jgi:phosphopantothenoylcysteine decarboxylase/phosphopantothenate--cysteine ligase
MKVIVTAGPTREYIDRVRFITNASSGKMGCACAAAAASAGHEVTLLTGPVCIAPPAGCAVASFVSVDDLAAELGARFDGCDALIMTAAVGDFTVEEPFAGKIPRAGGPVHVLLIPTEDILAGLGKRKRAGQTIIGFAVEEGRDEEKAYREMLAKNCDYLVLNTPAAMAADESDACILSRHGIALPWQRRSKAELAAEIVRLLG